MKIRLLQRLLKPRVPIVFPPPSGVKEFYSHEPMRRVDAAALEWIRSAIRADYMGATEFEGAVVGMTFRKMVAAGMTEDNTASVRIEGQPICRAGISPVGLRDTVEVLILAANPTHIPEIQDFLTKSCANWDFHLSERPLIRESLFGKVDASGTEILGTNVVGWLDIENNWVATADKSVMDALHAMLGVSVAAATA